MSPRLIIACLAVIALLGWLIHQRSGIAPVRQPTGEATAAVYALGRVEGATEEIALRAWEDGCVVQVLVGEGQPVEAGQVLLQLDDQRQQVAVALATADYNRALAERERLVNGARPEERREAEADYRAQLAELEQARLDLSRTLTLHRKGAATQEQLDEHTSAVNVLEARVAATRARADVVDARPRDDDLKLAETRIEAAKAGLDLARVQVQRRRLVAPVAGQVLRVDVTIGEFTGPQSLDPPVILCDTSRMRVRAFVDELEAPRVTPGMAAVVKADGLPGQKFWGRVARVSPRMSDKSVWSDRPGERLDTKTREIWIDLQGTPQLVVGLRADVLLLPRSPAASGAPAALQQPRVSTAPVAVEARSAPALSGARPQPARPTAR